MKIIEVGDVVIFELGVYVSSDGVSYNRVTFCNLGFLGKSELLRLSCKSDDVMIMEHIVKYVFGALYMMDEVEL